MKRAKKGIVEFVKTESYYSKYTCPHCHINVQSGEISKSVTRFRCIRCGEEIIVVHKKITE